MYKVYARLPAAKRLVDYVASNKYSLINSLVRGRIEWDPEQDGRVPIMVIDGREISWEEFGRLLMTREGSPFKLEIFDPSDEV
jgi:hypothetical protein